ncbi:MAG: hypothetical protein WCV93_05205 [Candidatus Shapirobacteria bacterium]|jgi:CYTH domain-containing protein
MDIGEKWIKRKFFLKNLPDLNGAIKESWHRFYLYRKQGINLRIQKINDHYELERMAPENNLTRNKFTIPITKEEFDLLRPLAKNEVKRDSYQLPGNPPAWLMIYHGRFEGLGRIEVQFANEAEAIKFVPPSWFGQEIGHTPLGTEDSLLDLTTSQFQHLFSQLQQGSRE